MDDKPNRYPGKDWRSGKRINWTKDTKEKVYAAVLPYWGEYSVADCFAMAQRDVGISPELTRDYAGGVGSELTRLYGSPGKGRKKKPPVNGAHVKAVAAIAPPAEVVTPPPIPAATAPAEPPTTVETASAAEETPSAPIPAVLALPAAGSLEQAIGIIGKAFGGLIRDALADALTKALTNPDVAATLAEVLRPAMHSASIVVNTPEEPEDEPSADSSPIPDAIEAAKEHRREREHLPRILVAGMLPQQIQEIEKEFAGRASLRFWKSSDAGAMLRRQIAGTDAAVGMVNFMGHSADHTLSVRSPTYLRATGGVTSVKKTIERALKMVALERAGHVVQA